MEESAPAKPSEAAVPAAAAAQTASSPRGAFRIGEVCRITGVKPFVLRYWETEFPMLQPEKTASGHRLYRKQDIELILEIKHLLYERGFTIAGARRLLEERAGNRPADGAAAAGGASLDRRMLLELHEELRAALTLLENE